MYLCYIDESGTPEVPGTTSHYVLTGLSIPIYKWKSCEKEIASFLKLPPLLAIGGLQDFLQNALTKYFLIQSGLLNLLMSKDWNSSFQDMNNTSPLLTHQRQHAVY